MNQKFTIIKFFVLTFLVFGVAATKAQTSMFGTIVSDGVVRDYKIYIPAMYDSLTPVPLVFNFHGYGSNYIEQEQYGDFRAIADTANFIIVHPNGTLDNFNTLSWNTFDNSATNDLGFVANLIDSLRLSYNIDTTAIYSTGMSNGGFMSYELACQLSERIAAIASVTGSITNSHIVTCNPQHPMPVMQIHGTVDGTVPYAGNILFQPVENVVNYWIEFNNCDTTAQFTVLPNVVTADNCTAEHYVYHNGNNGSEVEFYKIIGGGHSWPGAPVNLNTTNMDFSASQEIWRFFRKYKLGGSVVTMNQNLNSTSAFNVFPNPTTESIIINFTDAQLRKIDVVNALGQLVKSVQSNLNLVEITLDTQGLYFIRVQDNGTTTINKVVKY